MTARRPTLICSALLIPLLALGAWLAAAPARAAGRGATVDVSIGGGKFAPATLHVRAGDTVVWTNNDAHDHGVNGDGFKSGNLGHGESYSHKFTRPGAYPYACAYHPREKGTVVVGE